MFKTYEFIFAGMPSSMYGLMVCDFSGNSHSNNPFGNKAEIIETRIPGRVRPLHYGVNYNEEPLSFKLVFGSDKELDRWNLQEIAQWLTGYQQYQWLQIEQPDLAHVEFRCLITELKPISVGWVPYAFEATVQCDCAYAYGHPFEYNETVDGNSEIYILNDSTVRQCIWPELEITVGEDITEFSITNESDLNYEGEPRVFSLEGIPTGGATVYVNNENNIIRDVTYGTNLYDGFNDHFFRLVPGDNILKIKGTGNLKIAGRFIYNVGA